MIGYGFDPALSEGSLKPPIFLISTFVFQHAAAGKRFFEGVTGSRPGGAEGADLSRFNGPNQRSSRIAWRCGKTPTTPGFLERHDRDRDPVANLRSTRRLVVHSGAAYAATER